MSLEALKQDVEQRQFCRFYFLYGSEPYLKQFYLRQLIAAALPDNTDLDLHRFEGQKTDPETFSEALWQYPAGENQVLLVQDLPLSSPLAAFLAGDDCEIPENTLVVVYDLTESPDGRSATFKTLKKKYAQTGRFVDVETVDEGTLARWVAQQFRRRGRTISPENTTYFLSVEERNMESMLTEIEKISAYCADGTVTREALEKLCVKTVQARAYELNDLILNKNADGAFRLLEDLWALHTPPQMVLGSLFSCFANLYQLKRLSGTVDQRAARTGLKPFVVRRYDGYLKKISTSALDRLMDSCAEADVLSKSTGTDPVLLVTRLVTEALAAV